MVPRYPHEDVEIDGVLIRKGEPVTAAIAAANRDPRAFTDPEQLDITRTAGPPGHLGFAHGPHFCLGAPLARAQTEIALTALPRRFPHLALAAEPEAVRRVPDPGTWRLASLPVTLSGQVMRRWPLKSAAAFASRLLAADREWHLHKSVISRHRPNE